MKNALCLSLLATIALAAPQNAPISEVLRSVKTCFVDNQSGDQSEIDVALREIQKTKVCTVVAEREKADITLRLLDSANRNTGKPSTNSNRKLDFTRLEVTASNGSDILWSHARRWPSNIRLALVPVGKSPTAKLIDDFASALHP